MMDQATYPIIKDTSNPQNGPHQFDKKSAPQSLQGAPKSESETSTLVGDKPSDQRRVVTRQSEQPPYFVRNAGVGL